MNIKKFNLKKIAILSLTGLLFQVSTAQISTAQLQRVETVNGKALYYYNYDSGTLTNAGCDPAIYNSMVQNYLTNRTAAHASEYEMLNQQLSRQTPNMEGNIGPGTGAQGCFESAAQQIARWARFVDTVFSMFSGSFDMSALLQAAMDMWATQACQELNNITGQMVNNAIGSPPSINIGVSTINNVLGQNAATYNGNGAITTNNGQTVVGGGQNAGASQTLCNSSGIGCN